MSETRPQPNEAQWLAHKSFIRQEYLFRGTSLKRLVEILAIRGLQITKAQLEYKLKKWQFSKNLDKQSWQYIEREISSRESQRKKSEVIFCGRRIERLKVLKETRRHSETSIFKQLTIRPASPASSQLIVRTPPPFEMNAEWPDSLPWLCFLNEYWNSAQDGFRSRDLAIAQTSRFDLLPHILCNLGWVQTTGVTRGVSELVSVLTSIMPELYAGEHFHTAQGLTSGSNTQSALELFKILVYRISNGIGRIWLAEWQTISAFLTSCLIAFPLDLKTLRTESIVFQAFFDNLLKQEVWLRIHGDLLTSLRPLDTIRWLLDLGQNPNCCLNGVFGGFGTSVREAAAFGDLELIQLLLDCHVRVHGSQAEFELRVLIDATMSGPRSSASKLRMLQFLSGFYNFSGWQAVLYAAIRLGDIGLVRDILAQDPDAIERKRSTRYDDEYSKWNPENYPEFKGHLTAAAIAGDDFLTLMLDHLEGSGRLTNSVTTDLLIAASSARGIGIVRRLLRTRTLSMTCDSMGATPLLAAVAGGNLPVCELYLEIDGRVSPAHIALAACRGHGDVLFMLISFENCVNEPLTEQDFVGFMDDLDSPPSHREKPFSILETIIYQDLWHENEAIAHCLTILIEAGARFKGGEIAKLAYHGAEEPLRAALAAGGNPDDQNDQGFSALECALRPTEENSRQMKKCSLIVEILLQAKARLVGGEVVTAIRNCDEASMCLLLRHGGTLKDTDSWGRTCLEAEILARNNGLIQKILEEANDTIDLAPVCAALQMEDWELVHRLLPRLHVQAECLSMQGTAIGLAAASGNLDILESLHTRFSRPPISYEALLPFRQCLDGRLETITRRGSITDGKSIGKMIHVGIESLAIVYPCKYCQLTPCLKASPLALAALGENHSGFQRLLEKGYRADIITLTILAEWRVTAEFVELLKIHQPRLDNLSPLPRMVTPLCIAIQRENTLLTNYLVEAGMDVNGYDKILRGSYSPLQSAVLEGNLALMGYLLAKGASVNHPPSRVEGLTALQAAVIGGHIGLANMLLQHGARINARGTRFQGSALELAARSGNIDMLQLLLHHGAITTGPGRRNFVRAVAFAMDLSYHTTVRFLKGKCGWTKADESLLRQLKEVGGFVEHPWMDCKRLFGGGRK
ncbi:uncharacterized protein FTOL_05760 [Fusarium torulosum]|uniref:Clr5 domain-containing protein n=1 Tax=Fusarium torulosum TaxID=33205 RepID=A0AAE8M879_9HYPO|nr:uncharacterized protein FTOL_05760 [Fusarium torulosum]